MCARVHVWCHMRENGHAVCGCMVVLPNIVYDLITRAVSDNVMISQYISLNINHIWAISNPLMIKTCPLAEVRYMLD